MDDLDLGNYINTMKVIGRGTFATVYLGRSKETPPRDVAIKAMYPEKMKQKQAIQEREIEVMRSLRHRNVVELLDVIVRNSGEKSFGRQATMFLVFEYAAGGDFSSYLKQQPGRKLSETKTRHWMTQLRDGLMFLSQQKILHRDLKPQNLLLSHKDESLAVLKLADFGFARFINSHSMIETVCGTPLYMAPEILRSEKYEVSSDLWSVGCILYQCLVGRAPFVVSTHFELLKRLEKEDAVIPAEVRSQISPECADLVMRLLDKNRDSRIAWDAYFRHPWFGVGSVGSSDHLAFSTSSSSSGGGVVGHFPMEGTGRDSTVVAPVAGLILDRREASGHRQRIVERALAVLELADMKTDHGRKEEAAVLYKKGLECLGSVMTLLRSNDGDSREDATDSAALIERLKVKQRIYQERSARISSTRRSTHQLQQPRAPSELMLEFALQMGRDGGVSEILGDFSKAEKLYSNGCIILEQLLSMTPHASDKVFLNDALQRFLQRIVHVKQEIEAEHTE